MKQQNEQIIRSMEMTETTVEETGLEEVVITAEPYINKAANLKDEKKYAESLRLYMNHVAYAEIAETVNVKLGTLHGWIYRDNWKDKRKDNDAVLAGELLDSKKYKLEQVVDSALDIMLKTLVKIQKNGSSLKDLPQLTKIIDSIERLSRLTQGKATSITEERSKRAQFTLPLSQMKDANLVKIKDPFALEASKDESGV